jgi:hypothetical protein
MTRNNKARDLRWPRAHVTQLVVQTPVLTVLPATGQWFVCLLGRGIDMGMPGRFRDIETGMPIT